MFLRITIGGIKRELKKKKIGSCGSRFGAEMREIWCLEDWGIKGASPGLRVRQLKFCIYRRGRSVIDYKGL